MLASLVATCTCQPLLAQYTATQPGYGGQIVNDLMPHPPSAVFTPQQLPPAMAAGPATQYSLPNAFPTDVYSDQPLHTQQAPVTTKADMPPGVRKSLFQRIFASGTYIPQFEDDSLGFGELEAGIVLGIPFFRPSAPLLITPRFAVRYLDSPADLDLPDQVYDAEVSFRHIRKFGNGPWAMNAAVTLGEYSDFESSDGDAFRVTGQAFAVYESSAAWKWVFGAVYLNREDLALIPAVGAIYTPNPNLKFDAIMPRPRISWRLPAGMYSPTTELWAYVGGEFGGGIWSISRPASVGQDLMTYNDFRLLAGIETKADLGGISHRVEFGYVFGRELEFASSTSDVNLDDSLFVRLGVKY